MSSSSGHARRAALLAALTDEEPSFWAWHLQRGLVHVEDSGPECYERHRVWRYPWRVDTPAEAWELLATHDLIPRDWVAHPTRRYYVRNCALCEREPARRCRACLGGAVVDATPPSMASLFALAGDPGGMLAAEAIVRELTRGKRFVWRATSVPAFAHYARCFAKEYGRRAAELAANSYAVNHRYKDVRMMVIPVAY